LEGDINKDELFLLHTGHGGRLLVFCAQTELTTIYQSEYLICHGTFEMAPDCSYQLYTVHVYLRGEGLPLLYAILPSKNTETYKEMMTALRSALIERVGDMMISVVFDTCLQISNWLLLKLYRKYFLRQP